MQRGSQIILFQKAATFFERVDYLPASGQIGNRITNARVGFERQNLAVDAKAANTGSSAEFESCEQTAGIFQAKLRKLCQLRRAVFLQQMRCSCSAKLYRLIDKNTAKAKSDHFASSSFFQPDTGRLWTILQPLTPSRSFSNLAGKGIEKHLPARVLAA